MREKITKIVKLEVGLYILIPHNVIWKSAKDEKLHVVLVRTVHLEHFRIAGQRAMQQIDNPHMLDMLLTSKAVMLQRMSVYQLKHIQSHTLALGNGKVGM